jgi:uncharacterized OB-fold protein
MAEPKPPATPRPLAPDTDDPRFAPFWEGTAQGRLRLPACGACGTANWPPRALCPVCFSEQRTWRDHEPAGTLQTWTIAGIPTAPGYAAVPYVLGVVEVVPGDYPVRLIGQVSGEPEDLAAGMPLRAAFRSIGDAVVVDWAPTISTVPTNTKDTW